MTDRLVLRRFTASDGPALHGYLSRPDAVEYEPYGPVGRDEAEHLARERATDPRFWAVQTTAGTLVGNLYLATSGPQWWHTWELGYVFHPDHWGRGYATEACRALLDAAFDDGAHRVLARCDPVNVRSWALLERLGMRREGHSLRSAAFDRDAEGRPLWHDTVTYAVLEEEWGAAGAPPGRGPGVRPPRAGSPTIP